MKKLIYLLRALYSGEGIGRIFMNEEIYNSVELSGIVVDIGGGEKPSYSHLLLGKSNSYPYVLDIVPNKGVNVVGSVTRLPFRSNSVDRILCFNVLEHVFDYTSALKEIGRVLKPGGILYGRVPFLFGVHEDPCDYWRYTRKALEEILTRAGFVELSIKTHGGLFLVMSNLLTPLFRRVRIAMVICGVMAVAMNHVFSIALGEHRNRDKYPLGYFFIAHKQEGDLAEGSLS